MRLSERAFARIFAAILISTAGLASGACGTAPHGFGSDGAGGTTDPNGISPNESSDAGSSQSSTDAGSPRGDAGTDGGPVLLPDGGDPYDTPTVCTSGQMWTLGDSKSSDMEPGLECHTCHVVGGEASGKEFDISGTVYPTAHEPDDCYGVTGATIEITDANGSVTSLSVSTSGNFEHDDAVGFFKIATPYTAVVKVGSKTRPMISSQTDGNCNHCHTTAGTESAPGRIMMP